MGIDTPAGRWDKFVNQFSAHPSCEWEFLAPRSGWAESTDTIYKLFVRRRPQTRHQNRPWRVFEDDINIVDPHVPRLYYEQTKPTPTYSGSLVNLMGLKPERYIRRHPALEAAIKFLQHKTARRLHFQVQDGRAVREPSPRQRVELAFMEKLAEHYDEWANASSSEG